MRKYIYPLLFIAFSFSLETVAIIDFEGIGVSQDDAKALTQRLTTEMIKIGKFTIVERSEMKRLLDEQKFQYSGCVDISCAVETTVKAEGYEDSTEKDDFNSTEFGIVVRSNNFFVTPKIGRTDGESDFSVTFGILFQQ